MDNDPDERHTNKKRKANCILEKGDNNQIIYSSIDDILKIKQYSNYNENNHESHRMVSTRSGINFFKLNEIKEKQREINSKTSEIKV